MYRKQIEYLTGWLHKTKRKPLIIRGARQVGKSTLVRLFAEKNNTPLAEVNLERYPELSEVFSSNNPDQLISSLEALPNIKSITDSTMLFLDEIQAAKDALPMLRYLYEDKQNLPVLAAGSLLEFLLSKNHFSMPVGRIEYLHMGPMTFSEFLLALDETKLVKEINDYQLGEKINLIAHKRLLELLRVYYFVGGMPEAVDVYAKTKNFKLVSEVHNSIIETYRDDLPKYIGTRNLNRMLHVFNFIARNVGNKVKYSNISNDEQSVTLKKDIEILHMARIISKVIHSHCSGLPLQADIEDKTYKLIFLDVGLMNAICGMDWLALSQLTETKLVNEGAIAEQFIGQHLLDIISTAANRQLTYWLREGKSANAEVDFVIALANQIIPIEVKSGKKGSLKSLHQFAAEKKIAMAVRFDNAQPSIQSVKTTARKKQKSIEADYKLISLPLYMVEKLPDLIYQIKTNSP